MTLLNIDFGALFTIENSIPELLLRATVLYLGLLFMLRVLPRRTGGELAMMDLVFILLITESASHAMGDYTSLAEGFIMIVTLLGWNYLLNTLSYHVPFIQKLVSASALPIIKDGKLLRRNMRRELLSEDELMDCLRKEGIDDPKKVKAAFVEGDGEITVIKRGD